MFIPLSAGGMVAMQSRGEFFRSLGSSGSSMVDDVKIVKKKINEDDE